MDSVSFVNFALVSDPLLTEATSQTAIVIYSGTSLPIVSIQMTNINMTNVSCNCNEYFALIEMYAYDF